MSALFEMETSPWLPWCANKGHPEVTHNVAMDESWCLCGESRVPGDAIETARKFDLLAESRAWRWPL